MKKILLAALITLTLSGCAAVADSASTGEPETEPTGEAEAVQAETTVFAMDTVMSISAYGPDSEEAILAAAEEIYRLEALLSVTDGDSDVAAVNENAGTAVAVSDDTAELVARALDIAELTGGLFDPTIYPVLRAWGFTTDDYQVPEDDALAALMEHLDYTGVVLDGDTVTVPQGTELDLGGVAKGYAGDVVRQTLLECGVTSAMINLGGDVQTLGAKPDGSGWRVAIQDPEGLGYLCVLEVEDQAVITSGSYERYFAGNDGNIYHHIIDPRTGSPADSGLTSVTVVTESATLGDGLATALFVMGPEDALAFWRETGDFEALLVLDTGEVVLTEGLEDCFSLTEEYADLSVTVAER